MPERRGSLQGLYLATAPVRPISRLAGIVAAAIEGGVSIVQFREKNPARDRHDAGRTVADVCRGRGVPFLVNDDPDLARDLQADGVHVGRWDTPPLAVRAILGPHAVVGVTVYGERGEEEAAQRAGANYVAVGPFYPSPTKPEEPILPLHVLDEVVHRARLPVFAIGGITAKNAGELASHGVAGVAVLSAIMGAPDPRRAAAEILAAFQRGRRAAEDDRSR